MPSLLPREVERADVLAGPGQAMLLPPRGSAWESRLAQIVAVAESEVACRVALDAAGKAIVVDEASAREVSAEDVGVAGAEAEAGAEAGVQAEAGR